MARLAHKSGLTAFRRCIAGGPLGLSFLISFVVTTLGWARLLLRLGTWPLTSGSAWRRT